MNTFKFQTRYTESSRRLDSAASLVEFDKHKKRMVIAYNLTRYDGTEVEVTLNRHIYKGTQSIEVNTNGYKYTVVASPMIKNDIIKDCVEVQYIIHGLVEETL
jgi:hypothetical protein